ncbi:hypothetical protein CIPAW_06G110800 [Carya illinoinensis]|uniref:Uncharacterized protein n=1 Tax=Carya illinoinensis TaxID=32201 RepID=A0A8T1QAC3_CARIL|nr:hypothetical protein CIPAW_06G110800 [Carya illinoinensis]KAG6709012.1 hypothetical protein I3842_06G111200 [Carya illinoinensis]
MQVTYFGVGLIFIFYKQPYAQLVATCQMVVASILDKVKQPILDILHHDLVKQNMCILGRLICLIVLLYFYETMFLRYLAYLMLDRRVPRSWFG